MSTGHFSGSPQWSPSGDAGSNDTGLMSVSGPGEERIKVQTDIFEYFNIDLIIELQKLKINVSLKLKFCKNTFHFQRIRFTLL